MSLVYILAFFISVLALIYYLKPKTFPNEPPVASFGWKPTALEFGENSKRCLAKAREKYGPIFTLNLGLTKITYVCDQSGVEVLGAKDEELSFNKAIEIFIGHLLDSQPFSLEKWNAVYSKQSIKEGFNSKTVLNQCIDVIEIQTKLAIERWSTKGRFDLFRECSRLVLRSVCNWILGTEDYQKYGEEMADISYDMELNGVHPISILFPWLPFGEPKACQVSKAKMLSLLRQILKKRREQKELGQNNYVDILLYWIHKTWEETGEKVTDEMAATHLSSMIFAAHTNTAGALGWGLTHLAMDKSLMATMRENQKKLVAELRSGKPSLKTEDLSELKHFDSFLKEILRTYANAVYVPRLACKDITLSGYFIPKGRMVAIMPLFVQDVLSNSHLFSPSRWDIGGPDVDDLAGKYFQFGFGRHSCLGRIFAHNLLKIVWTRILMDYDIVVEGNPEPDNRKSLGLPFPTEAFAKLVPL